MQKENSFVYIVGNKNDIDVDLSIIGNSIS
jgi:hypothetical protein